MQIKSLHQEIGQVLGQYLSITYRHVTYLQIYIQIANTGQPPENNSSSPAYNFSCLHKNKFIHENPNKMPAVAIPVALIVRL
jgi:hypothetical protein